MKDLEFEHLKIKASSRRRIKTNLIEHQESIKRMIDADISLPLIFEWLTEHKVETALTTLRRFVKKTFGEDFYDDFSNRNGWQKDKRKESMTRAAGTKQVTGLTTTKLPVKQGREVNALGNPSDINNFFNNRKS